MIGIQSRVSPDTLNIRVLTKNYFTPLEPKHALKARVQRYSKIFLKMHEPITVTQSPVSIRNYNNNTSSFKLPKIHQVAQGAFFDVQFPLESPSVNRSKKRTSLVYKSVEEQTSNFRKLYSPVQQIKEKEKPNFSTLSQYTHKNSFIEKKIIQPVLAKKSRENQVMNVKIIEKRQTFVKRSEPVRSNSNRKVRLVNHGENTDENMINGWESDFYPDKSL